MLSLILFSFVGLTFTCDVGTSSVTTTRTQYPPQGLARRTLWLGWAASQASNPALKLLSLGRENNLFLPDFTCSFPSEKPTNFQVEYD